MLGSSGGVRQEAGTHVQRWERVRQERKKWELALKTETVRKIF